MQKQQGAALVIVLALMTGALVVGLSGMQSSLIDERLAGNYRASAQAQMNAEQAAALAIPNIEQDYKREDAKSNRDSLKISTSEDVKQLRYADVDAKNPKGKTDGNCDGEGADEDWCFYFPLKIGKEYYWAAFGAVKNNDGEGAPVSQHVVLVELQGGTTSSFPTQEIIDAFNKYGILSDKKIDVDSDDDKKIPFYGLIHTNQKIDDDHDDIEVSLENDENESKITTGEDENVLVPSFDFDDYLGKFSSEFSAGKIPKTPGCDFNSSRVVSGGEHYCSSKVEIEGSSSITNSEIYFEEKFDLEGGATISGSKVYFNDKVEIGGSVSIDKSTVYVNDEMDIDASLSVNKSTIIVDGKVDVGDDDGMVGLSLTDTAIVSGEKIEIDAANQPKIANVLIMSGGKLDVELEDEAEVNGGWFYSGKKLDMEINASPEMEFCGGLMAQGKIEFDARPPIKRFNSSGRNDCPEFGDFDGLLEGDSGELKFDEWQ